MEFTAVSPVGLTARSARFPLRFGRTGDGGVCGFDWVCGFGGVVDRGVLVDGCEFFDGCREAVGSAMGSSASAGCLLDGEEAAGHEGVAGAEIGVDRDAEVFRGHSVGPGDGTVEADAHQIVEHHEIEACFGGGEVEFVVELPEAVDKFGVSHSVCLIICSATKLRHAESEKVRNGTTSSVKVC